MALREIRKLPDEILHKTSRKIDTINERITTLLDDMAETMYHAEGLGLAAVQIGVLRRCVVIDVGEGLIELINPVITRSEGQEVSVEGCLSVPGYQGEVVRPEIVDVEYMDRNGETHLIEGATGLFKKALCHEIAHLDGEVYTDVATNVYDLSQLEDDQDETEEMEEVEE